MKKNIFAILLYPAVLTAVLLFAAQTALADDKSAQKGDNVEVSYVGSLKDGTVFDSSEKHGTPLKFVVGSGQVIKGFDEAVLGMKQGEEKSFTIQPGDAYGEVNPKLIQKVSRSEMPKDREPQPGMMLIVTTPQGGKARATITQVTANDVTLDMNHPLAGKALTFKIKVIKVS